MDSSNIEFVDELPEQTRGATGKYVEFFDALRANPGRWAKFPKQGSPTERASRASQIKTGRYRGSEKGEFEGRSVDGVLYARYVGGESQ